MQTTNEYTHCLLWIIHTESHRLSMIDDTQTSHSLEAFKGFDNNYEKLNRKIKRTFCYADNQTSLFFHYMFPDINSSIKKSFLHGFLLKMHLLFQMSGTHSRY